MGSLPARFLDRIDRIDRIEHGDAGGSLPWKEEHEAFATGQDARPALHTSSPVAYNASASIPKCEETAWKRSSAIP